MGEVSPWQHLHSVIKWSLNYSPSAHNYCECSECYSKQVMPGTVLMLLLVWYLVRYVLNSLRSRERERSSQPLVWIFLSLFKACPAAGTVLPSSTSPPLLDVCDSVVRGSREQCIINLSLVKYIVFEN